MPTAKLIRALHSDPKDHRQGTHLENGMEDEIRKFIRKNEMMFQCVSNEPCIIDLEPTVKETNLPQQVSLIAQRVSTDQ